MNRKQTASEAVALTDDFVLMHRGSFGEPRASSRDSGAAYMDSFGQSGKTFHMKVKGSGNSREPEKVCNYCHKGGHWKADCQLLRSKPRGCDVSVHVEGVGLAAPAPCSVTPVNHVSDYFDKDSCLQGLEAYCPFF